MKHFLRLVLLLLALPALGQDQPHPQGRPNVLFILVDDLSAEALGCYGNEQAITPNLDQLAARGFVMDRAYTQASTPGPARAALFTGLYPQQQVGVPKADDQRPALPQYLKEHGYTTLQVGKVHDHPAAWTEAYDLNINTPQGRAKSEVPTPHEIKATDKAIELLAKHKDAGKPFFLMVGYTSPQTSRRIPQTYLDAIAADDLMLPKQVENDRADIPQAGWTMLGTTFAPITDARRREALHHYYASVSFLDAQVGRLLQELDKQGLAKSTLIVFMADRGYRLGEHGFWGTGGLHNEAVRVPMISAGPGIEPGQRWPGFVEAVDHFPSMCIFTGLPVPEHCVGLDLVSVIHDPRPTSYTRSNNGHLIQTKDWAYMRYSDGSEELYDMANDPKQFTNLAKNDGAAEQLQAMRALLDEKLKQIENK